MWARGGGRTVPGRGDETEGIEGGYVSLAAWIAGWSRTSCDLLQSERIGLHWAHHSYLSDMET